MENITNAKTGNVYKGGNLKKLQAAMESGGFSDPRFGTFNDFKAEGYWVKKGSKAAARLKGDYGTYCVFSVEQTTMPVEVVSPAVQEQHCDESDYCEDWGQEQPERTYEQSADTTAEQYAAF